MSKYNIHTDFDSLKNKKLPLYPKLLPTLNRLVDRKNKRIKLPKQIKTTSYIIDGYQLEDITVTVYEPLLETPKDDLPCLIYYHGGGFAIKEAPYHINLVTEYALEAECKVVFVNYRLMPKSPFPIGLEDCYSAYDWVRNHTEDLGVNKNKIAVGGDSAGGALATGVTLMARDRGTLNLCFQMLIYPVTDARQNTNSMKVYVDTPMWNSKLNKKMWDLYLQDGVGDLRNYASLMENDSLAGLPNAYIEVAQYDCLHDEGLNYANKLISNGQQVELNDTKGTVHGYDMVENSKIVISNKKKRINALKKAFS
ncbi:alpha/beta hydrolase [Geomicrobium sediminis]|uniref:Acetyl esterase/lipase n=1 Tax=Geomicrobium sediminis TaxID=1347788 RepID=A0ABS2PBY4_9BACL|nr:alpha/beta hydrolase [Geomicrobium sediminis]MBM7632353.1 acetyl esterase/lipase [Geomicrobium sediminis]